MWTKPNRMWKARRKYRLLYQILVTQLRGLMPAVHNALEKFVWAIRRLEGQVHSFDMAKHLGILPGSRAVRKADLDRIRGMFSCWPSKPWLRTLQALRREHEIVGAPHEALDDGI